MMRLSLAGAVCALTFAACSSGASGPLPASPGAATNTASLATIRLVIPKPSTTSSAHTPQYVSPSTTQMAIDIQQGGVSIPGYPQTIGLAPTSSGCTSTLTNTLCQITLSLSPAAYTVNLSLEDAAAHVLSTASAIPFTATAGATTTLNFTLSGVPHSIAISPGSLGVHGSQSTGFVLYGLTGTFTATAVDADGNMIIGPGAPTFTENVVNGNGAFSIGAAIPTSPNQFQVFAPEVNGEGAIVGVTAQYTDATCAQPNATCTTNVAVTNDVQTLLVANSTLGTVSFYRQPYTGASTGSLSGMSSPQALAIDKIGNIFVADQNGNAVWEFSALGFGSKILTGAGIAPSALAIDPSGNLAVAESGANQVTILTPPYTAAPTTITGVQGPQAVIFDHLRNLFVANTGDGTVDEISPPYTSPTSPTISGLAQPWSLALDSVGNLFVGDVNSGSSVVRQFSAPYTTSARAVISTGINRAWALAVDASGNLFVANYIGNTVTEYAPPYSGAPIATISNGITSPQALAIDGLGNLLVANSNANTITVYAPPFTGPPIATITSGIGVPTALLLTP